MSDLTEGRTPAQKPSVGSVVLAFVDPSTNNGSDVAPATITRVWSDTMVNLKVHLDANADAWKTSVSLFATREDAEAAHPIPSGATSRHAAYWPSRV